LGGLVIDATRRKGQTLADLRRDSRDRTAFRQWTEDPTLQGNRGRRRRRRGGRRRGGRRRRFYT
jgi:hypothetical protein